MASGNCGTGCATGQHRPVNAPPGANRLNYQPFVGLVPRNKFASGQKYHGSSSTSSSLSPPERLSFKSIAAPKRQSVDSKPAVVAADSEESNEDDIIIDVEEVEGSVRNEHSTIQSTPTDSDDGTFNQGRLNSLILSQSQNFLAQVAAATDISRNISSGEQNPLLASYISNYLMSPCIPSVSPLNGPTVSRTLSSPRDLRTLKIDAQASIFNHGLVGHRSQLPYWHLISSYQTSSPTLTGSLGYDLRALNRDKTI